MSNFPGSLLILNGKSAGDDMLREAIHLLRRRDDIQVRVTWEKGDAERYVAEAIALGVETVIAGGGDGTINEVASALVHSESDHTPVLGILPLGTANDFATSAGIPETLDKALQLAIVGKAMPIDIAEVNDKPVLSIWLPADSAHALPPKRQKN
jgi:YegS/Rv2252/BmrU family lipid kinase